MMYRTYGSRKYDDGNHYAPTCLALISSEVSLGDFWALPFSIYQIPYSPAIHVWNNLPLYIYSNPPAVHKVV